MDISGYNIIAQATPRPAPPATKTTAKPKDTSDLKIWLGLQKQAATSDSIYKEFSSIKLFCEKNPSQVNVVNLSPTEKLKIFHTKPNTDVPEIPEKFTIFKIKTINGKDVLISTITYEVYPDENDKNNCRIVKLTMNEKPSKQKPRQEFPEVDVIRQAVDVLGGKTILIDIEKEMEKLEEQLLDKLFPPGDGKKAAARSRTKTAASKLKRQTLARAKASKDVIVRYLGYPMRKSMAEKLKLIKEKAAGLGYELQVTCTMGGKHILWQHGAGYAVDFVNYTPTKKGRKYLRKYDTGIKDGKRVNISEILEEGMKKLNKDKNLDLSVINEYIHGSTYKTGDHFHINVVNPYAGKAVMAEMAIESNTGSKDATLNQDALENAQILLNGSGEPSINGENPEYNATPEIPEKH